MEDYIWLPGPGQRLQSIINGSQGRSSGLNLEQTLKQNPPRTPAYWLTSGMIFSCCWYPLSPPLCHSLPRGWHCPRWARLCDNHEWSRKCCTTQAHKPIWLWNFSSAVPSSQMNLVCIKLKKEKKKTTSVDATFSWCF